MNTAIFGLGYVGLVNMACLSDLGNKIYGCDIKSQKVDLVNAGKSPIFEPKIDGMIEKGVANGMITASVEAGKVVSETDLALICVGTPSKEDGSVNLNYTINTTIEIASIVKKLNKKYTIVFRSTIPPGTIENIIMPEIKAVLGDDSDLISVSFLPEFLREGSAVDDFFNGARIVIGNDDGDTKNIEALFSYSKATPIEITDIKTAEFVKYVDNAYHAVKVAFANEVYTIGSEYNVNIDQANKIFLMDNVLNVSPYYLKPGLPFGGSCLPKDMRAITKLASNKDVDIPLLGNVLLSNRSIQNRMAERIIAQGKSKIVMYGLAFKEDTDDVRESPLLLLAKDLIKANIELNIYDPLINIQTLRIEQPEIVKYISNSDSVLENAELIIIGKKGFETYNQKLNKETILFDLSNSDLSSFNNRIETLY